MDADALRGMAVVTVSGAERLGRVDDVLFETDPLRASALVLKDGDDERALAFSDVSELGRDAIMVERRPTFEAAGLRGPEGPDGTPGHARRRLTKLTGLKVVDESGTLVGQIERVGIDPETGDVDEIDVRRGDVLGVGGETQTLDRDRVVGVGLELLTVRRSPA